MGMLAVLLSFGAIDALIPLLIIIILIAAAAGLTRGYSVFRIFGIDMMAGVAEAGLSGRGSLARKTAFKGSAPVRFVGSFGEKLVKKGKPAGVIKEDFSPASKIRSALGSRFSILGGEASQRKAAEIAALGSIGIGAGVQSTVAGTPNRIPLQSPEKETKRRWLVKMAVKSKDELGGHGVKMASKMVSKIRGINKTEAAESAQKTSETVVQVTPPIKEALEEVTKSVGKSSNPIHKERLTRLSGFAEEEKKLLGDLNEKVNKTSSEQVKKELIKEFKKDYHDLWNRYTGKSSQTRMAKYTLGMIGAGISGKTKKAKDYREKLGEEWHRSPRALSEVRAGLKSMTDKQTWKQAYGTAKGTARMAWNQRAELKDIAEKREGRKNKLQESMKAAKNKMDEVKEKMDAAKGDEKEKLKEKYAQKKKIYKRKEKEYKYFRTDVGLRSWYRLWRSEIQRRRLGDKLTRDGIKDAEIEMNLAKGKMDAAKGDEKEKLKNKYMQKKEEYNELTKMNARIEYDSKVYDRLLNRIKKSAIEGSVAGKSKGVYEFNLRVARQKAKALLKVEKNLLEERAENLKKQKQ